MHEDEGLVYQYFNLKLFENLRNCARRQKPLLFSSFCMANWNPLGSIVR